MSSSIICSMKFIFFGFRVGKKQTAKIRFFCFRKFRIFAPRKKTPVMGRIMAIDYGQKRVGFAVTDELQICAHALETVPVAQAFDFLKDYLKKEKVDVIVIGEAKQLDNTPSESCRYIEPFVNRLRKELPNISPGTELARMDERFTSRIAFQTMIDIGLKKKDRQNKANVDKMSAAIILQSYLEQQDLINLRDKEQ